MRFGHIRGSDLKMAHLASYVTSVWDALMPAWTFPKVYSATSLTWVQEYFMVTGGLTTGVGEVEARRLRRLLVPLGYHQRQLPLQTTPLHRRLLVPPPILPLPRPQVPRLTLLPRPRRCRPLLLPPPRLPRLPLPPLPRSTRALGRSAGWQSRREEWCLLLIRAIPKTSSLSTRSYLE